MYDIEQLLQEGKTVQIKPQGTSMYPLFIQGRDEAILAPLPKRNIKRGEVVLFRRPQSILVLHRVVRVSAEGYYFVGDNQCQVEGPIQEKQLIGIMVGFVRKGKTYSVSHIGYRLVFGLWHRLLPIRPQIYALVRRIKKGISLEK